MVVVINPDFLYRHLLLQLFRLFLLLLLLLLVMVVVVSHYWWQAIDIGGAVFFV